jgi:hypothetical protein
VGNDEERGWPQGEEQAWRRLADLSRTVVCRNAGAAYDAASGSYILPLFNTEILVSTAARTIRGSSGLADTLLNELSQFSRLASLNYLSGASDIPLSGSLIHPRELSGGELFFTRGEHILPLDRMAARYGRDLDAFVRRGLAFGGRKLDHGDASIGLLPFPRVSVVLIIWKEDGEFPARADLLFDSTCSRHLSTDILWATAMMTILLLLT